MSNRILYNKPHLDYPSQLSKLEKRGLLVNDKPKALHLLEHLSYYRLSGYWYPFLINKENHIFKDGASFEDSFSLYCFDNELKQIISNELGKIEIGLRAKMIYILSKNHNPFWFAQKELFSDNETFMKTLSKISKELKRSDAVFIKSFKIKYDNVYPPSWITFEVVSMGTLSMLYKNLKPTISKRELANHFGLNPKVLSSWLHGLVYTRNLCAHHSRVWNRELGVQPKKMKKPKNEWIQNQNVSNKRIYYILCMIKYIRSVIHPTSKLKAKLVNLLEKYPNVDLNAMGFSQDWDTENLWI